MRLAIPLAVLIATACAQSPPPVLNANSDRARLEGMVLTQAGEPIARASVQLETRITYGPAPRPMTAAADDTGRFVFDNIPPGPYSLSATKAGFLAGRYGQRTITGPGLIITLDAGKTMTNAAIKLTAQSAISGQVIDQDGDPVVRAQVSVLRSSYLNHRWQMSALPARGVTDDRGNFRINGLNPGRYYLSARGASEVASPEGYVTTFYPNTIDPSSASPIDIGPAADTKGIDVRMLSETAYSIKVTVSGMAAAGATLIVNRLDADGLDSSESPVFINVAPDDTFELRNLRPGTYVAQIAPNAPVPALAALSGRVEFTVKDSNRDDVVLTLSPPVQFSGAITLANGDLRRLPPSTRRLGVQLQALDPGVGAPDITGDPDGSLPPRPVPAGRYRWDAYALPEGTYVKSARYDNQDVTRVPLDVVAGSRLEIVLAANAATVSGNVQDADGNLVFGYPVTVWPKLPDPGGLSAGIRTADTDTNGGFRVNGLAPGEYYVVAWEEIDPNVALFPDFLTRFVNVATLVKLSEGSNADVPLRLVPSDQVARELAKLP